LIDAAIEADEALMEKYLSGSPLEPEELSRAVVHAIADGALIPVFFMSAKKDIGVQEFMDGIVAFAPSPIPLPLKVKQNGQIKTLSCLFYVATSRARQTVHVIWDETAVQIFTHDGEHIITYPRPETTGIYYGPRAARTGTPMKDAGQNPSAGINGTARRKVSKGGYVGVLACKFYAGYRRQGEQVTITWDATTVTITDATGHRITQYDKPTQTRGWHGPTQNRPSTKS
jgi:hypothetical protein